MSSFVELENVTGKVQKVYDEGGELFYINPYGSKPFSSRIAELFLNDRRGKVRVATDNEAPPLLVNEKPFWIANMTGNPFYPKEWEVERIDKNDMPVVQKIPNPNSVGKKLTWDISVGQGNDPYGRVSENLTTSHSPYNDFNLPGVAVTLRIRQRICVGHKIGQVIMQRDALLGDRAHGQVIECRAPTPFEPTMMWDLPKILFYAGMVSQEDFTKDYLLGELKRTDPQGKSRTRAYRLAEVNENPQWIETIKDCVLGRLFYRIVDLEYGLPTEAAFNRYFDESVVALEEGKLRGFAARKAAQKAQEKAAQAKPVSKKSEDEAIPAPDAEALAKMARVVEQGLSWDDPSAPEGEPNAPAAPAPTHKPA